MTQTHRPAGRPPAAVDVHRSPVGHAVAVVWWTACALLFADVLHRGHWPSNAYASLGLWLLAVFAYAVYWRPELVADDEGVLVRNPLRDIRAPWRAITSVGGRWSLTIRTERRSYTAFAAAPRRRPRRSRRGEIPQPAPAALTESLVARWESAGAGGLGEQPGGEVSVRWAWEVLAPGVALAVALVVVAVLS